MSAIEFYDNRGLECKTLIWVHSLNCYDTFVVRSVNYNEEIMIVAGVDIFRSREQDWFRKLNEDIPRLYILKEEY